MLERVSPAIAANRFGLGARPGELAQIGAQPRDWLIAQLSGSAPLLTGPELHSSGETLARGLEVRRELRALAALDAGLRTLKDELGPAWADTAVLLATEFGRTAATNGTRGTDHGTATATFLLGGAVQGGRVIADWPGLSSRSLYQGRDLKPTANLRSVLKGVLSEHLLVSSAALEFTAFPNSADARPIKGLFRA